MEWLWQGIITSFICFLLSNLFSFIKKCVLTYYFHDKSCSTSKTIFKLYWKSYFCILINSLIMNYIVYNVDIKRSMPFGILVLIIYSVNNLYLFYSIQNVKNKFTYKKPYKISNNDTNNKIE